MSTNTPRGEIIAATIEAMRALHESVDPLAQRVESLRGLEIDEDTRKAIENGLATFRSNLEDARATIDEIAAEDRVTGAVLIAGLEEIARKVEAIELPPRAEDVPDPIEQARAVIDGAMSDTMRSIDEIMAGILPMFYDSMAREYRDNHEVEKHTQVVGLRIHLPKQIEDDPRGVAVGVEVVHLASIDNRQVDDLIEHDEHAVELADHFDGQAIALVSHGHGKPLDDNDAESVHAFVVTVVHPTGIDTHIETREEGSSEWTVLAKSERIPIGTEDEREALSRGDFGKMPLGLARFYATYLEAISRKH